MPEVNVKTEFDRCFVDRFEFFLFDADGVLWLGGNVLPGALEFLNHLSEKGKSIFIISNNSTRSIADYVVKLRKLGFEMIMDTHIINPALVLAQLLAETESNLPVYIIGMPGLQKELSNKGIVSFGVGEDSVSKYTNHDFIYDIDTNQPVRAVVVSYDVHINYAKIMKAANYILHHNAAFIATNEDAALPGPNSDVLLPGAGVMVKAVEKAVGKAPMVIGKPSNTMFEYIKKRFGADPEQSVMFGDRCDTDIEFGRNVGMTTVLVGTGVHNLSSVSEFASDLRSSLVPDYFCSSFVDLLQSLS